jgi:hypothetical protein
MNFPAGLVNGTASYLKFQPQLSVFSTTQLSSYRGTYQMFL